MNHLSSSLAGVVIIVVAIIAAGMLIYLAFTELKRSKSAEYTPKHASPAPDYDDPDDDDDGDGDMDPEDENWIYDLHHMKEQLSAEKIPSLDGRVYDDDWFDQWSEDFRNWADSQQYLRDQFMAAHKDNVLAWEMSMS